MIDVSFAIKQVQIGHSALYLHSQVTDFLNILPRNTVFVRGTVLKRGTVPVASRNAAANGPSSGRWSLARQLADVQIMAPI